ncbi:helix-turn-helix domain-containing protein [Streptomyces chrestomyceticus]|uniref:helix-turn-helix domain-containing protein n=1 Tax=Streptomyces chrestomyceticus TaxID=68185 RepID=UPI0033ED8219
MQQRLEYARGELARTGRPIAEIATEADFADQSHLTRMMRRYVAPLHGCCGTATADADGRREVVSGLFHL